VNQIGSNQSILQKRTQTPSDFVGGIDTASGNLTYDRFERFEITQNCSQNTSIEVYADSSEISAPMVFP
jgi:hypothetical protein